MRQSRRLNRQLNRGYEIWASHSLIGFDLYAFESMHSPLRAIDYDPGEVLWDYRAMLAEDVPRALQVLSHGGKIESHDFGPVPQVLAPGEQKLVRLLKQRINEAKLVTGRTYDQIVNQREFQAASTSQSRHDIRGELAHIA